MSTRHLFLPFLVALAGFVSCDEFKPEVAVGCVTVDNEYFCALTSAIGGESEGNQKWLSMMKAKSVSMFPDIAAAAKIRGTSRSIYLSLTLTSLALRQCRFLLRSAPKVKIT